MPFGRDTFAAFFLMRFEIGRKLVLEVPVPVSQMLSAAASIPIVKQTPRRVQFRLSFFSISR